jgi:hypothetical protein
MDEIQFIQVWTAFVTSFVIFITFFATRYLGRKTTLSKDTQTVKPTTNSAQTETMRFTERLTNYGNKKVNFREKFDKFCEICEATIENEVVGFCQMCEKFLCLKCCQHHEKIPLSESHVLTGKDEFSKMRNKKKLFEKKFVTLQNYHFYECNAKECSLRNYSCRRCTFDHVIQPFCLTHNAAEWRNSIGCFMKRINNGCDLVLQWQDKLSGHTEKKYIPLSKDCTPADISMFKSSLQIYSAYYFTIPNEQKICKYTDDADVEFIHTCGKCYGIAVFDEGLAITINIPTSYSLPEWQVQFITFKGYLKKQICFDNDGEPLFKEPKYLTANNAQDILFLSDQGNHSVIALDVKGYILFKYTHETIQNPRGLTCDDEGNIYVASGDKLLQIDQHGTKSRVILSSKEKQLKKLIDVCYSTYASELGVLSESAEVTILKPLP